MPESLNVGDQMRFSVELIKEIHEQDKHASELVVVEHIERLPDGTVMVHVQRAPIG